MFEYHQTFVLSRGFFLWILPDVKKSQDDNSLSFYSIKNSCFIGELKSTNLIFDYFNSCFVNYVFFFGSLFSAKLPKLPSFLANPKQAHGRKYQTLFSI